MENTQWVVDKPVDRTQQRRKHDSDFW